MTTAIITEETPNGARHKLHALIDIGIVFLFSAVGLGIEKAAKAFGLFSLGEIGSGLFAVLAGLVGVLYITKRRGFSHTDLGFRKPERYWTLPFWVIGIFLVYFGAQILAPMLLSLFIEIPAADFSKYSSVYQNLPLALLMFFGLPLTASIPEEIIYRGFLMDRLSRIFGKGTTGTGMTILVQAMIFGSIHFQWGIGGVLLTTIMGLVWGTAYILSGRNLWVVILAHSFIHVIFVILLYISPPAGG